MYDMDNYNEPYDYDGFLHDNKKEIVVEAEDEDLMVYLDKASRDKIFNLQL